MGWEGPFCGCPDNESRITWGRMLGLLILGSSHRSVPDCFMYYRSLSDHQYHGPIFLILLQCYLPQLDLKMILVVVEYLPGPSNVVLSRVVFYRNCGETSSSTSTPQPPFKIPQIPSNKDDGALSEVHGSWLAVP